MLLWCSETELSLTKSSSKPERLSLRMVRKQRSLFRLIYYSKNGRKHPKAGQ